MKRVDTSFIVQAVNDKTELLIKHKSITIVKLEQSGVHKYQSHFHVV